LSAFREEWIRDRVCMDIGCNEGLVTIAVAAKWFSKKMTGIDIDKALIKRAGRNLYQKMKTLKLDRGRGKLMHLLAICSYILCLTRQSRTFPGEEAGRNHGSNASSEALRNVEFKCENILKADLAPESFDTIICLSLVKWIHLCYGDQGVTDLFRVMNSTLKKKVSIHTNSPLSSPLTLVFTCKGLLILEYQNWKSYKNTSKNSELQGYFKSGEMHKPSDLSIKPGQLTMLLESIGMKLIETNDVSKHSLQRTFQNRPLWVFRKE